MLSKRKWRGLFKHLFDTWCKQVELSQLFPWDLQVLNEAGRLPILTHSEKARINYFAQGNLEQLEI